MKLHSKTCRLIIFSFIIAAFFITGCTQTPIDRSVISSRIMSFDTYDFDRDLTQLEISRVGGNIWELDTSASSGSGVTTPILCPT